MKKTTRKRDSYLFYTHLFAFLCFIFDMCVKQIRVWNIEADDKYLNWCEYEYYVGTKNTGIVVTINQNTLPGLSNFFGQGRFANTLQQKMPIKFHYM